MSKANTVASAQQNSAAASSSPARYNAAEDLLTRNLPGRANKIAFIDETGAYTFAELSGRVNRCANALLALGYQRQARIALCLLDNIDFPSCFLGAIEAGMVPIPLNTMLQPVDYAHVLSDAAPEAVIASQALLPQIQEAARLANWRGQLIASGTVSTEFRALSELMQTANATAPVAATTAADDCFWLYSSGSTGKPKAAVHKQTSMSRTAELFAAQVLRLSESDLIFSAAKLFFAYGLGNALSFPLALGATAILHSGRANAAAVCKVLRKQKPTIFCGVPTLFSALLACDDFPNRDELAIRLCVSAGEALPEQVGRAWTARTGVEIVDGIGSTEMLHIFISNRPGACRYGTTGALVPGYKARLMDESGREAARGVMGDLYVSGPTAASRYWNDPERTKSTFTGEWVKTGDRFRVNEDGDYIYCGRSDEMLKVSGIWVSPTEVESALVAHDAVLEAAVVGAADEHGLTKPKAFVVLKSRAAQNANLADELRAFVKTRLAPYKCPRWIEFRDELPKTATGKIRRNILREEATDASEASRALAKPPTREEHSLASESREHRNPQPAPAELRAEHSEVMIDGKRLETLHYWPPTADDSTPTIVMLHEGLGSTSMWKDFPEQVARKTRCGVLVYSRYGHGKSQRLAERRAIDFMHREAKVVLPELLEHFKIERPILLGHSDGASIALIYAGTRRPGIVRALVLEAAHVFVEEHSIRSIQAIRKLYESTDLPTKLGKYHNHVDETFYGWNDIWLDPKFRDWNIEEFIAPIKCPVLVIQGETDEYGTVAQVAAIQSRLPQAQTLILPRCGHWPHRDSAAAVVTAITNFLGSKHSSEWAPPT